MKRIKFSMYLVLFLLFSCRLHAQDTSSPVSCELISEMKTITPGDQFSLLVRFSMQPGWHLYWKNPGETGAPPKIQWILPQGVHVQEILFPTPSRIETGNSVLFGYSENCALLILLSTDTNLPISSHINLQAEISWVACGSSCIPGKAQLQTSLDVAEQAAINPLFRDDFVKARALLPKNNTEYSLEKNGETIEIQLSPLRESFADIQNVFFFSEDPNALSPQYIPAWRVSSDGQKLFVPILPKDQKPLEGVLVVSFSPSAFQKDLALHISSVDKFGVPKPCSEPQQNNDSIDPQALSKTVQNWGAQKLDQIRNFLGSEFAYVLFLAFFGGMILNIMPCVLPVVSLKVFQFMRMQGQKRVTTFKHGLAFSFGIVFSFWLLVGAIFILQSLGKTVGWGFQLQEPLFVTGLIIVLFILSLSLFGVFEFGTKIAAIAAELDEVAKVGSPLAFELPSAVSSFFSGILATFVASPCTGPLLGSAIGFAAIFSPLYGFAIFTTVGIGMAFPYLLLSLFPGLLHLIPKPGRWMVTFKQLMGFFLLATVLWLIWVLQAETNQLSMVYVFISFFLIAFGFWIYGTWAGFGRKNFTRAIAKLIAFGFVIGGASLLFIEVNHSKSRSIHKDISRDLNEVMVNGKEWEPFSPERLAELRAKHIPVFLDFSAKWCLTCQTNGFVLESSSVREAFIEYGVVKMFADWTQNDETITKALRALGRNGVPVYALY
ncbi:MAG: hypothetical protein JWO53_1178, partial [Chlamydiia bacterium]|nr:hypothetical protein [Chlamydiia bacterium]